MSKVLMLQLEVPCLAPGIWGKTCWEPSFDNHSLQSGARQNLKELRTLHVSLIGDNPAYPVSPVYPDQRIASLWFTGIWTFQISLALQVLSALCWTSTERQRHLVQSAYISTDCASSQNSSLHIFVRSSKFGAQIDLLILLSRLL